jgi:hypothetical protein
MPPLVPRWKIPFSTLGAPQGAQLFDPVIVEERGVMVAGGPLALSVFLIGDQHRLWFTVKPHTSITGFTVTPGALYVQDGVVLSAWHLTEYRCFAAVNLVTEERWAPESDDDEQKVPPDSLYDLPAAVQQLQSALLSARHRHWAALGSGNGDEIASAARALASTLSETERLVYSAPAVRDYQIEGGSGRIFSICLNGVIVALTEDLLVANKLNNENPPLRPELAMAELLQPGGNVLCYLYYVGKDGGIVAIDGTSGLERLPARWASKGTPVAGKVLPLRYVDGLLFGGGILGADFFVLELDPTLPPRLTVSAPEGGWKSYETSIPEKLVLLSNGKVSRLVAYDAGVKLRDRWGERRSSTDGYSIYWRGTGQEGPKPSPKLAVEADTLPSSGGQDVGFRVLLANTVDTEDPAFTTTYRPTSLELYNNTLAGKDAQLPHAGYLRCRPCIARHTLYCVVRATNSTTDTAPDMVVAYSIAPIATEVATAAEAQLERNRLLARPIVLQVDWIYEEGDIGTSRRQGPSPYADRDVLLVLNNTAAQRAEERTVRTDNLGRVRLDSSLAGVVASPSERNNPSGSDRPWGQWVKEVIPATLTSATLNVTQFTWYEYHGKALALKRVE